MPRVRPAAGAVRSGGQASGLGLGPRRGRRGPRETAGHCSGCPAIELRRKTALTSPGPRVGGRRRARAGSGLAVLINPEGQPPHKDRQGMTRATRPAPRGAGGVPRVFEPRVEEGETVNTTRSRRRPGQPGEGTDRPGSGVHARGGARCGPHSRGDLGPPLVQPVSRFQMRIEKVNPNPRQVTPIKA